MVKQKKVLPALAVEKVAFFKRSRQPWTLAEKIILADIVGQDKETATSWLDNAKYIYDVGGAYTTDIDTGVWPSDTVRIPFEDILGHVIRDPEEVDHRGKVDNVKIIRMVPSTLDTLFDDEDKYVVSVPSNKWSEDAGMVVNTAKTTNRMFKGSVALSCVTQEIRTTVIDGYRQPWW